VNHIGRVDCRLRALALMKRLSYRDQRQSNRTGCLMSLSTAFPVAQICSFSGRTSHAAMNRHSFRTIYRVGPVRAAR
jgi:hypothetical protein